MHNFNDLKPKIIQKITPVLEKNNLDLFDFNNTNDFDEDVLQILVVDHIAPDKPMDFELLTRVNEEISNVLDQLDNLFDNSYLLEVTSAGIERQIRNSEELQKALNSYVHVDLNVPIKDLTNFEGFVENYLPENNEFQFSFFIKGQKKHQNLKFDQIKFIRHAVKF